MPKDMCRKVVVIGLLVLLLGAGVALGSTATKDSNPVPMNRDNWFENFDSYETGSTLHGQGGWFCWDGLTANNAYITDVQSHSASNSLEIKWIDQSVWQDMVHAFTDVNSGNWTIRAWLYIPSDMTGASDFILMNTYVNGSHTNNADWSLQLEFGASAGTIKDLNDATKTLPLVKDAWAQLRVSINFEEDLQTIYYNGQFLEHTSWKNHCAQGGAQNFAAIDLYAGSAYSTSVYWDDLSVTQPAETPLSCDAGGPYDGTINVPIQFTGTAQGGFAPYTYFWDFTDGGTSTEQNPTHAFTVAGTYDISLTVTDLIYDTTSDTAPVTVIVAEPALMISSITGKIGVSVGIQNIGTAPATNVQWTINFTGFVFPKVKSDTITSIAAGATSTATAKILGLGPTTIIVKATCTEGKTATKTATAKVFLFFVFGVT
jgi:PKD repeat protein